MSTAPKIRFEPAVRVNAGNYPALHSLGVTHLACFEFECEGQRYWGECHRTRVANIGTTYDSNIRTNDKNGRAYSLREGQMSAIRLDIAAAMQEHVRAYAAALDIDPAPVVEPVETVALVEPFAVPAALKSFTANVRHAVNNPRMPVTIGGGSFNRDELRDVLAVLDDYPTIAHDLALLKSTNAANATARANLEADLKEARAIGQANANAVASALALVDSLRGALEAMRGDDGAQDDTDAKCATLAPIAPRMVANTSRACYWLVSDGKHSAFVARPADVRADEIKATGGYVRLDELMRVKGEDQRTIDGVLRAMVLDAHKSDNGQ